MAIGAQGKIVLPATELPTGISLSRRYKALLLGNRVVLVQGLEDQR
ncbi:MAG: hypothetical protein HC880_09395 [Bacteroidia bacterium]|nr:hypothetical protein [Bacteroidia bacterium]